MACAGSTSPGETPGAKQAFDPALAYRLSPSVALRREPFGALSYHYGNRRLTFLRSAALAELVERLGEFPSGGQAVAAVGVPEQRRASIERALSELLASDVICVR
jgi:putative mycofactocin binding protein MftB